MTGTATPDPGGPRRGRYHGLLQILKYNQPMYLKTAAVTAAALLTGVLLRVPRVIAVPALAGIAAALFWSASSLAVSHWIYDRSPLTRWDWLGRLFPGRPRRWMNIHAGLDETFGALQHTWPGAGGTVFDVYDPAEMTEPSIVRARQLSLDRSATAVNFRSLPVPDGSQDAAFLIFAAHELRRHESRLRLFQEIGRALAAGGRLVLVEHLRDGMNFLAFGPGFLHFLPRREWLRVAAAAGLTVREERRVTPFVAVFAMEKRS